MVIIPHILEYRKHVPVQIARCLFCPVPCITPIPLLADEVTLKLAPFSPITHALV